MAWAAILGSLLGAAGQVGGGALASKGATKPSDMVNSYYNPYLDYANQASTNDALSQIGWGNLNNIPDPIQQLIGQISAIPMDVKTRRRALTALTAARTDPTLLTDPMGKNFTTEQILNMNKTGDHPGRIITRSNGTTQETGGGIAGGAAGSALYSALGNTGPYGAIAGAILGKLAGAQHKNDTHPSGAQTQYIGRLNQALNAAGVTTDDLLQKFQEKQDYDAKIQRLKDAGYDKWQEQSVIDRARAAATANALTGAASDFATTGNATTPLQQNLLAMDENQMKRLRDQLGVMANFGNINPGQFSKTYADAQLSQLTRLIQNQLGMSTAISTALNPGLAAGQNAGSSSSTTNYNSAQIAAMQAQAANSLRAGINQDKYASLGSGLAGGLSSLGSGLSTYGMYSLYGGGKNNTTDMSSFLQNNGTNSLYQPKLG